MTTPIAMDNGAVAPARTVTTLWRQFAAFLAPMVLANVLLTLVARRPFTLPCARAQAPREVWSLAALAAAFRFSAWYPEQLQARHNAA